MSERARLLDGKVHVRSVIGCGTEIDVSIPMSSRRTATLDEAS